MRLPAFDAPVIPAWVAGTHLSQNALKAVCTQHSFLPGVKTVHSKIRKQNGVTELFHG